MDNNNYYYKFRSIEKLLDEQYKELDNEEIYFSDLESLNDPVEGFMNVYWQGDEILWTNFYKNYIYSIFNYSMLLRGGTNEKFDTKYINVRFDRDIRDKDETQGKPFPKICNIFLSNKVIQKHIRYLAKSNKKVYKKELLLYLVSLNIFILQIISAVFNWRDEKIAQEKLKSSTANDMKKFDTIITAMSNIKYENINSLLINKFIDIISEFKKFQPNCKNLSQYHQMELLNYPYTYISKVKTVMYPDYYVSCFCKEYDRADLWGYYADSHKGVCLIFKPQSNDGKDYLPLERTHDMIQMKPIERNQNIVQRKFINNQFKKVLYTNKYPDVSFFRSLGKLSHYERLKYWYFIDKIESRTIVDINKDIDNWRKEYWDWIDKCACTKTKDWENEKEYRIVLEPMFDDTFDTIEKRKFKYDFKNLQGIIFGIKTSTENKKIIIRKIIDKCKMYDRQNFDFYQAAYDNNTGKIYKYKLNFIQLSDVNSVEKNSLLLQ